MGGCKDFNWCFGGGTYHLLLQRCSTLKMEAAHPSGKENLYQIMWLHISGDSNLHHFMSLIVLINILHNAIYTFFRLLVLAH